MAFRFLHLADLHLETHFGGRPQTRERLRAATLEAFERAVERALDERLHAVLVAGDAFDDSLLSLRTELAFRAQIERLARAGTWFLYACGNHDPGASGRRAAALGLTQPEPDGTAPPSPEASWLARVHVFRSARPKPVRVTDAEGRTVGVVVGAGHAKVREERNLAAAFTRLDTALPVVGLLHTQVESAHAAEVHDRYAPSTRADYERVDYDYWALGHVHERQRVFDDLPVWYAGNLQGRNMREAGPKGGLLVELEAGRAPQPVFLPFAPVRWERLCVEGLESVRSHHALVEELARRVEARCAELDEELAVVLEPTGATPLASLLRERRARGELEAELIERTAALEVVLAPRELYQPRDLEELRGTPSVLRRALELCAEAREDAELLERIAPPVLAGFEGRGEPDPEQRRAWLVDLMGGLEEELLERCLASERESDNPDMEDRDSEEQEQRP